MMNSKKIKLLTSIIIVLIMCVALLNTTVYAANTSVTTQLSRTRWVKNSNGEYIEKRAYALNTGKDHPIYQILSLDDKGTKTGTNYYCLNAEKGYTWTNNLIGASTEYDKSYDFINDKSEISKLVKTYSDVVNSKYYTQIMWLLDNMYIANEMTEEQFLEKVGIVHGDTGATHNSEKIISYYYDETKNPNSVFSDTTTNLYRHLLGNVNGNGGYWYIDSNNQVKDVILPAEIIEVVEQAALWHYTNGGEEYNCYTSKQGTTLKDNSGNIIKHTDKEGTETDRIYPKLWLKYAENSNSELKLLANEMTGTANTGLMLQEQADILYNYLIDSANKAAEEGYTSTSKGTLSLNYTGTSSNIVEVGEDYRIGPMVATTTGNTKIDGIEVTPGAGAVVTDSEGNKKELKANEEFYITIPKEAVTSGSVTITVKAHYTAIEKTLWTKQVANDEDAEQPTIEVKPKSEELSASKKININKEFDLALRKTIIKVTDSTGKELGKLNEEGLDATRIMTVNPNTIPDTAEYKHRKDPIVVRTGDIVTYRITIYNEGEIDGYASKIIDQLPTGLTTLLSQNIAVTSKNGNVYTVTSLENNRIELTIDNSNQTKTIKAFDGTTIDSDYIDLECKVEQKPETDGKTKHYLTNIAYIAEGYDTVNNKTVTEDRNGNESKTTESPSETAQELNTTNADDYKGNNSNPSVYNNYNEKYFEGEQDDDDFEKLVVMPKSLDLSLRKFISKVSSTGDFEDETNTITYNRAPEVDTTELKAGTAKTATYNHSKEPIALDAKDYVLYTIRVYNEGEIDGYASQVIDYLPENLNFVDAIDGNKVNTYWNYDGATRKVTTKEDAPNATTLLKAFDSENDDGKGSGLSYVDIQIICRINKDAQTNKKLTNIAEISEYKDEDKNIIKTDRDSESDNLNYPETPENYKDEEITRGDKYIPGQEDDDDFEKVIIREFDLALRKFITDISGKEVTTRVPKLSYENGKITYTHPKDVVKVVVGDTVTYTLRVFNEGNIAGYAEKITDDIPEYLEYLPENETNKEYKWVMYDKEGKETDKVEEAEKIVTDYASKANGEENLLKAFDKEAGISETNPSHIDVKVAFKVKDPKSNKIVITNKAQISEDADENGKPVNDIDSIPDEWNEGEDDQDYENVSVEYFDLSLLKYVTKAIVTENGKTKTTKTGNTGASTDITPKVEIYRKRVKTTIVKFEYTIKVTNEGDIEGYAKELTDYVPEGLKFYSEDNKGWKDEGNNVISTELLKDTLLKPGQSATVKVILRWVNGENNLGLKTNVAEISKDYNEKGVPDRDSTPDNKKPGEDDIDDAPVLLTISTGILENTIPYVAGTLGVLVVFGLGIIGIKKYVL